MKKIIITLVLAFVAINLMAQEHLSFKGIPIEGSMTDFCQKLKDKGFISIGYENNTALFTGDFTGRKAKISVTSTDDGKNVFAVAVFLTPVGEWNTLVSTYDYYKDLYTRKYGSPSALQEYNPDVTDSNFGLMHKLHEGMIVHAGMWKVTGGDIQLSVEKTSDKKEGTVMILYRDSQNVEAKIQKDLDEI